MTIKEELDKMVLEEALEFLAAFRFTAPQLPEYSFEGFSSWKLAYALNLLNLTTMVQKHSIDLTLKFANTREEVLLTANKIVNGDRQDQYGDPTTSFQRIAELWNAVLPVVLTPAMVARMLILLKVSRSMTSNDIDSWVDIAGYAGLGAECQ